MVPQLGKADLEEMLKRLTVLNYWIQQVRFVDLQDKDHVLIRGSVSLIWNIGDEFEQDVVIPKEWAWVQVAYVLVWWWELPYSSLFDQVQMIKHGFWWGYCLGVHVNVSFKVWKNAVYDLVWHFLDVLAVVAIDCQVKEKVLKSIHLALDQVWCQLLLQARVQLSVEFLIF